MLVLLGFWCLMCLLVVICSVLATLAGVFTEAPELVLHLINECSFDYGIVSFPKQISAVLLYEPDTVELSAVETMC